MTTSSTSYKREGLGVLVLSYDWTETIGNYSAFFRGFPSNGSCFHSCSSSYVTETNRLIEPMCSYSKFEVLVFFGKLVQIVRCFSLLLK